jgi:hypothetical protein
MARAIGQQTFGRTVEESLKLGHQLAGYCQAGWFRVAGSIETPEAAPLAALKAFAEEVADPDFINITPDGRIHRVAAEACLGDILVTVKKPFWTVLDTRTARLQYFCPVALRLFQRLAEEAGDSISPEEADEVAELEALFAR